jgi:tetratricopeptide (TPR) repeat protein
MGHTANRIFVAVAMVLLCGLCGWRSIRLALAITPDSAEYHFGRWQTQMEAAGLDRALALNPRYTAAWIARGLAAETAGDRTRAEASLLRAAGIDHTYLPRWTLANFYLRSGNLTQFWIWTRRAAEMAYDPRALFQLCWHASGDAREILERAIPEVPALRRAYLDFLLRTNRAQAAGPLALELSQTGKPSDVDLLLRYCDVLLALNEPRSALAVWNTLALRRLIPDGALDPRSGVSLTNGELATVPLQRGFDWRLPRVEGAMLTFTTSREMAVSLSGKQPESCDLIEQYLPVLPNVQYRFHYHCRTQHPAPGLSWSFVDPLTLGELAAGPVIVSPGDPNEQTLAVSTPPGCDLLRILLRYRRPPGSMRAEGSVVFSGFSFAGEAKGEASQKAKGKSQKSKVFRSEVSAPLGLLPGLAPSVLLTFDFCLLPFDLPFL